jgi:hypothetical protein
VAVLRILSSPLRNAWPITDVGAADADPTSKQNVSTNAFVEANMRVSGTITQLSSLLTTLSPV